MDPLSVASIVSTALSTTLDVFNYLASELTPVRATYGTTIGLVLNFGLNDVAKEYGRIRHLILDRGDEGAIAFKEAVSNECNLTAVAVSWGSDHSAHRAY